MISPSSNLPPESNRRWILILGAVVAIGPLSIDMYLPGLPTLQRHFHSDATATQLSLAVFFAGLAIGQLIYGPVSDRFGRRTPLLVGLAIYVIATLGCALAPSMPALIGLRFLQALGSCSGIVMTRAMVRDRFPPQDMARILSLLILVIGIAPILAPILGSVVLEHLGWQAIFHIQAAFGVLCFVAVATYIAETHRPPPGTSLSLGSALAGYAQLLSHRRFMGYALAGGTAQGGMFAYISVSSFVFIEIYALSPNAYAWIFGANAFGLIAASQVNRWLLGRYPAQKVLRAAIAAYFASSLVLLFAASTGFGGLPGVLLPLWLCITSLGFTFPNSVAAAMAPFGDRAGAASGLLGTLQFVIAGTTAAIVGHWYDGSAVPMAAVIAVCGLGSNLLLHWVARAR
jgi:DHA1 family bicyclomycin/chloramphenicol resistance-like MFS transporter